MSQINVSNININDFINSKIKLGDIIYKTKTSTITLKDTDLIPYLSNYSIDNFTNAIARGNFVYPLEISTSKETFDESNTDNLLKINTSVYYTFQIFNIYLFNYSSYLQDTVSVIPITINQSDQKYKNVFYDNWVNKFNFGLYNANINYIFDFSKTLSTLKEKNILIFSENYITQFFNISPNPSPINIFDAIKFPEQAFIKKILSDKNLINYNINYTAFLITLYHFSVNPIYTFNFRTRIFNLVLSEKINNIYKFLLNTYNGIISFYNLNSDLKINDIFELTDLKALELINQVIIKIDDSTEKTNLDLTDSKLNKDKIFLLTKTFFLNQLNIEYNGIDKKDVNNFEFILAVEKTLFILLNFCENNEIQKINNDINFSFNDSFFNDMIEHLDIFKDFYLNDNIKINAFEESFFKIYYNLILNYILEIENIIFVKSTQKITIFLNNQQNSFNNLLKKKKNIVSP